MLHLKFEAAMNAFRVPGFLVALLLSGIYCVSAEEAERMGLVNFVVDDQAVHHDIWDRDFPSPPALLTVKRDGKQIDAVAQTTKQGFVYLFDRTNGKPLFPIQSRKYPPSTVPGEIAASEQPLPARPAPFARQLLTEDLLTSRTPEVHRWALEKFKKFRSEGQFVPFGIGVDTVVFPGFDGGAEWGGPAVDPVAPSAPAAYGQPNDGPPPGAGRSGPSHSGGTIASHRREYGIAGPGEPGPPAAAPPSSPRGPREPQWYRRPRWIAALAAVVLVLVGVGTWVGLSGSGSHAKAAMKMSPTPRLPSG
jgi:hypothetical protein